MANTALTIGVAVAASQADQETGTSTTAVVTPGRQQFHASAAKAWVRYEHVTGTPTNRASYNVTSLTDNGTGDTSVVFTTSFSSATGYTAAGFGGDQSSVALISPNFGSNAAAATGSFRHITSSNSSAFDIKFAGLVFFGDQ